MTGPRSRKWFGTVWEEEDIDYLKRLKYQYLLISALDQTEEEHEGIRREHWHVVIQFKSNRNRPNTLNAHWEIPRCITGAIDYCMQKGQPSYEEGDLGINTANKEDWEGFLAAVKTQPKEALLDGPYSRLIASYYRFADIVYTVHNKPNVIDGELKHLWIYGPAGCGKTSWVWEQVGIDDLYVKNANKWWDGYSGQRFVLIDDWDKNHQVLAHHLKQWADRYPFQGEMKGAGRIMRPEHIIVTSNYTIEQCFEQQEDVEAFKRRFTIVYGRPQCDILAILEGDSNTGDAPPRVSDSVDDFFISHLPIENE